MVEYFDFRKERLFILNPNYLAQFLLTTKGRSFDLDQAPIDNP